MSHSDGNRAPQSGSNGFRDPRHDDAGGPRLRHQRPLRRSLCARRPRPPLAAGSFWRARRAHEPRRVLATRARASSSPASLAGQRLERVRVRAQPAGVLRVCAAASRVEQPRADRRAWPRAARRTHGRHGARWQQHPGVRVAAGGCGRRTAGPRAWADAGASGLGGATQQATRARLPTSASPASSAVPRSSPPRPAARAPRPSRTAWAATSASTALASSTARTPATTSWAL